MAQEINSNIYNALEEYTIDPLLLVTKDKHCLYDKSDF